MADDIIHIALASDSNYIRGLAQNAKVSIIVPVYNGEDYLKDFLESIRVQTSGAWVCLCVDDGSTDSSAEIIKSYCADDSRFKIFTQSNSGVGPARNTAMKHVETPYVMFADQDDLMHPQTVEIAVRAIEKSQTDMVLFRYDHFCDSWNPPSYTESSADVKYGRESSDDVRLETTIAIWSHIFRTASIKEVEFPALTGGEDTVFMYELKWRHAKWAGINASLYGNRLRKGSFSRGLSDRYIRNIFEGCHEIAKRSQKYSIPRKTVSRIVHKNAGEFAISVILTQGLRPEAYNKYDVLNEEFDRFEKEGVIDAANSFGVLIRLLRKRRYRILKFISCLAVPAVKTIQWMRK